ncbi:hypothetical protein JCM10914_1868 [Paenibacillus sp. JCM 10914]|nr:hypothetical protein JCM10914_1868 [Paenibacillus sp. JCM 10914]
MISCHVFFNPNPPSTRLIFIKIELYINISCQILGELLYVFYMEGMKLIICMTIAGMTHNLITCPYIRSIAAKQKNMMKLPIGAIAHSAL